MLTTKNKQAEFYCNIRSLGMNLCCWMRFMPINFTEALCSRIDRSPTTGVIDGRDHHLRKKTHS
jgi:hypothetical protein